MASDTLHVLQAIPRRPAGAASAEQLAATICKAVRAAAASGGPPVECTVLSVDFDSSTSPDRSAFPSLMAAADVVHVHQCLSADGLFLASQARLLGCRVVGSDGGGGEMPFVQTHKRMLAVYDRIQTHSAFGETAFAGFRVPVQCIPGPVDDEAHPFRPPVPRDPGLVIGIGPLLPHAGFESAIDALPPGLRLVIAGHCEDPAYQHFLAARVGDKPVRFANDLDAAGLRALIAEAGLFVQTSTHLTAAGEIVLKPELSGSTALGCLAAGLPVMVSRAGALPELGTLPGCWVAADTAVLATLLRRWVDGGLEVPGPEQMRSAVSARYGLLPFGRAYVDMMHSL